MAVREVLLLGDPRLFGICEPVSEDEVSELQDDLSELLQHECDHLDGVLAVARAIDGQSFKLRSQRSPGA